MRADSPLIWLFVEHSCGKCQPDNRPRNKTMSLEFLITSLIIVLIPGTGVIYTVSTGLFLGWRASVAAAVGCTLGIVPHLIASILGLTAILHMSALAFQTMKYAGVLFLLYLAWSLWRDADALQMDSTVGRRNHRQIVVRGILINILNPKLSLFFLAFLPQFISHQSSEPLPELLLLSAVFMAMTLVVFVAYGAMAHAVRRYATRSPRAVRWLQRGFAGIFALLGARLAMTER